MKSMSRTPFGKQVPRYSANEEYKNVKIKQILESCYAFFPDTVPMFKTLWDSPRSFEQRRVGVEVGRLSIIVNITRRTV